MLPLLVALPLSHNPKFVSLVCLYPDRPACLAEHNNSFPYVCLQYHLVEETRQHVKHCLDPPRVGGGYHPFVCIKQSACTFNYTPSNGGSLLLSRTMVVWSVWFNVSFWDDDNLELLVCSSIYVMVTVKSLSSSVIFVSFSSVFICLSSISWILDLMVDWWWGTVHHTFYPCCCPLLEFLSLRYEEWLYIS